VLIINNDTTEDGAANTPDQQPPPLFLESKSHWVTYSRADKHSIHFYMRLVIYSAWSTRLIRLRFFPAWMDWTKAANRPILMGTIRFPSHPILRISPLIRGRSA
jgi:hypothetical protein